MRVNTSKLLKLRNKNWGSMSPALYSDSTVYQLVTRCDWLRQNRPDLNIPELTLLKPSPLPSQALIDLCHGKRDFKSLRSLDLVGHIKGILGYEFVKDLDALAPSHLILPDGSNGKLEYAPDKPAILATRFERLFGLSETPSIAGTPVMLHLLAPNMRPVQITQDLANFWHQTYPQIRKELRGRYPRHPWPEDPLAAKPGIYRKRRQ
jgi:ATP-dependent helicase HrpB